MASASCIVPYCTVLSPTGNNLLYMSMILPRLITTPIRLEESIPSRCMVFLRPVRLKEVKYPRCLSRAIQSKAHVTTTPLQPACMQLPLLLHCQHILAVFSGTLATPARPSTRRDRHSHFSSHSKILNITSSFTQRRSCQISTETASPATHITMAAPERDILPDA